MFGNIFLPFQIKMNKVGFDIGIPFKEIDVCRYCSYVTNSISDYAERYN